MVSDHEIARWRLRSQHLTRPHAASAVDVVGNLLAVQAENPSQSAWAVAARTSDPSAAEVREALDDGRLIRTHVLRPTWHYVRAEDARWLLRLTRPRIRTMTTRVMRDVHGLTGRRLERASTAVLDILRERPDRARAQLAEALRRRRIELAGPPLMFLLMHLELDAAICSGRTIDDEHTYAAFDDRVAPSRPMDEDEALAEIALRYVAGHGPVTERDLAYWATLTLTDARRGMDHVRDRLASFEHGGRTYWHAPGDRPRARGTPVAHLLQILDEMYRGYQDSRWVLDAGSIVPRAREAAIGMAVVDAQLVAAMRRTISTDRVVFRLTLYRAPRPREIAELRRAADRYGGFLGLPATVELT